MCSFLGYFIIQSEKRIQSYRGSSPDPGITVPTLYRLSSGRHSHIFACLIETRPESLPSPGQLRDLYSLMQTDAVLEPHWPPKFTGLESAQPYRGSNPWITVPMLNRLSYPAATVTYSTTVFIYLSNRNFGINLRSQIKFSV